MLILTGHVGFIGSHIARSLTENGVSWLGVDHADPGGVDVRDLDCWDCSKQVDVIVHLASPTGVSELAASTSTYDDIIDGARAVAELATRHAAKVIFFSSSEVYGEAGDRIDLSTPLAPLSAYGHGKADAEVLLGSAVPQLIVIRPFNVYGPGQRPGFAIPNIIDALLSGRTIQLVDGGTPVRQFTYVTDVVEAVTRILKWKPRDAAVVNLAGPRADSIANVVATAANLLGCSPRVESVKPEALGRDPLVEIRSRYVVPDPIDGWVPATKIDSGLAQLFAAAAPVLAQRRAQ